MEGWRWDHGVLAPTRPILEASVPVVLQAEGVREGMGWYGGLGSGEEDWQVRKEG